MRGLRFQINVMQFQPYMIRISDRVFSHNNIQFQTNNYPTFYAPHYNNVNKDPEVTKALLQTTQTYTAYL